MSSEDTVLGSAFKLLLGDNGSPEDFSQACSITDIQNLGESKSQVETTAYCDSARTYIAGLREGQEVQIQANLIPGATDVQTIFSEWDQGRNISIRFALKSDPDNYYFEARLALLSWSLTPPVDGRAQLQFSGKITGNVIRVGF